MLDKTATAWLSPAVNALARGLHAIGVRADQLTVAGFLVGLMAAYWITQGAFWVALTAILISRLLDALDGAVARQSHPTDAGGFLDISLDFLFYAAIPLAFAWSNPAQNALAAATLLAAFMGTASSFLAFATLAAKRGLHSSAYRQKSFYFLGGLTEATETLACFAAMCLWPAYFAPLAYGFALLCVVTIATRVVGGYRLLRALPTEPPMST